MIRTRVLHVPRPSRVRAFVASRVESPVLDEVAVSQVLDRYRLDVAGTRQNLRLGRRSLNVAIETDQGTKVVKRYRPQWNESTVRYGHSIIDALEHRGFPAVRLTRTPDGRTWTCIGDHVFGTFDFVEGTNFSLNYLRRRDRLALTATAGSTLARLHRTLEGFVPEGEHHMGLVSLTGPRRRDVAWHAAKLDELTRRSTTLPDAAAEHHAIWLVDHADRLLDELSALDATLGDAALRRLVIHGDYGLHNLIFRTIDIAIPLDFELARLDWRVNDLISVIGKFRFSNGSHDEVSMGAFLDAYDGEFPLDANERRLFPQAWRLYKLQAAVQYWNSYFETDGPVRKLESARDSIAQADLVPPFDPGRYTRSIGAR